MSTTPATSTTPAAASDQPVPFDLVIGGMTCASCAARIERRLNKLDGVTATVNYATERARVARPGRRRRRRPDRPGRGGRLHGPRRSAGRSRPRRATPDEGADEARPLRDRLITSAVLSVPVVLLAMVPALQFEYWQWLSLTLAAPVVTWGAWPFHRAAWINLRHATATMDTLISLGVLAAFGWSLYALFLGDAGVPGMTHGFTFRAERGDGRQRDLPRGGRRRDHVHPRRSLLRGPGQASVGCRAARPARARRQGRRRRSATAARSASRSTSSSSATGSWCGPARRSPPTASSSRARRPSTPSLLTGEPVPVEVGPGDAVTGATVNAGGRLVVRATRVGADTQLAQIARLVEDGPDRQGAGAAPRRPHLGRVRADRHRRRRRHPRLLARRRRVGGARRSPRRSPC